MFWSFLCALFAGITHVFAVTSKMSRQIISLILLFNSSRCRNNNFLVYLETCHLLIICWNNLARHMYRLYLYIYGNCNVYLKHVPVLQYNSYFYLWCVALLHWKNDCICLSYVTLNCGIHGLSDSACILNLLHFSSVTWIHVWF